MNFDTSKARAAIFNRIRQHQKRGAGPSPDERAGVEAYLREHPRGPQPAISGDLKIRSRAMSERMSSTVDEVPRRADAPAAIARYLQARNLGTKAVIWPLLADLDWGGAGLQVQARPPRRDESMGSDKIGITGCFCALAETGTLVLLSGPQSYASTHLLPETHVALVPASRIVATMEDAFALMRAELGGVQQMMPRAVNMVSGPSRTGDIEQTIVLGAHGPFRVHLVVLADE
ncbi:MAG: lactate utilization protein [Burkholderiales bacterium]|jgi:L-lactate dehydrogenase complex protein LldG|nr:lactate utilization protein [Burkholderiales bacterium]